MKKYAIVLLLALAGCTTSTNDAAQAAREAGECPREGTLLGSVLASPCNPSLATHAAPVVRSGVRAGAAIATSAPAQAMLTSVDPTGGVLTAVGMSATRRLVAEPVQEQGASK